MWSSLISAPTRRPSQLALDPHIVSNFSCPELGFRFSYHPYNAQIVRFSIVPLLDRRQEYSWPATKLEGVQLLPEQKGYSLDDLLVLNLGFRVVGGAREAFNPDVWTVAWEDFDKTLRLTARTAILAARSPFAKRLTESQKEVR